MNVIPHPIPYQGSKRRLAPIILEHFPKDIDTLYEPFVGSGAITLAAATRGLAKEFVLGDSLSTLVEIWSLIIDHPIQLADEYEGIWNLQHDDPIRFYNVVRDRFNQKGGASLLLFLLTRCVKNAVRFNIVGEFNQSPDKRRLGTKPERMRKSIYEANKLLKNRAEAIAGDYSELLKQAGPKDLVYMDPPYQGTSGSRDQRYHQQLDRKRFVEDIECLLNRNVRFIISFDGRSGNRTYGPPLPDELGLIRLEIHAGRSSQATLNGAQDETYESLYLSPGLASSETELFRSISETSQQNLPVL